MTPRILGLLKVKVQDYHTVMAKKRVAIIPARGGSKRIPRKNLKLFLGKPLIAYPIEVALSSAIFDEVVVSTDDPEIAEISNEYGAKVPFLRNATLAGDTTPNVPVIADATKQIGLADSDLACCIYATAPLLQKQYLSEEFSSLI